MQESYWNNPVNKRTGIKRTLVHMLSGQNTTGGELSSTSFEGSMATGVCS